MGYTTYEFYTNTYYGNTVTEPLFPKWNDRASDKLKYLCGDNLTDDEVETYSTQIQKACCSLIDLLYQIDYATQNATDPTKGNVKSMSSGGQSITFGDNSTTATKVMADVREQNKLFLDTISEYLDGTGLLYMGA